MSGNILYFSGLDSNDNEELWESNGASVVEITPSAGIMQGGLNPRYLTAYNNVVLFEGANSTGRFGLWVSNGTGAGTYELTGITGANPMGLGPGYMTVYNNMVLFRGEAGVAGINVPGLWVTDGTVGGTSEIGGPANAGIANVYSGGLLPSDPDFTVFNGKVLFNGRDFAGNIGLWVTDGTAQNTVELAPITGAFAVGSPGSDIQPRYMAVLGNEVIFDGADQQDTPGSLWITNGTASGTYEIGGQGNAGIAGSPNGFTGQFTSELPLGIQPNDITAFNNKVLFAGYDNTLNASGYYADTDALWISNGTAEGTTEIGGLGNAGIIGINPAVSGGIFWKGSIKYPDFTVYNGIVLFVGYDADNHAGLWETNGTASGTFEIGGLGNAGISGGLTFLGNQSPDFTVYNGEVYFNAIDSQGRSGLWVTNGAANGTYELSTPGLSSPDDFTVASGLAAPTLAIAFASLQSNQTTVSLSGTIDAADAGLAISIFDGGTSVGTALANSSGAWSTSVSVSRRAFTRSRRRRRTPAARASPTRLWISSAPAHRCPAAGRSSCSPARATRWPYRTRPG